MAENQEMDVPELQPPERLTESGTKIQVVDLPVPAIREVDGLKSR